MQRIVENIRGQLNIDGVFLPLTCPYQRVSMSCFRMPFDTVDLEMFVSIGASIN